MGTQAVFSGGRVEQSRSFLAQARPRGGILGMLGIVEKSYVPVGGRILMTASPAAADLNVTQLLTHFLVDTGGSALDVDFGERTHPARKDPRIKQVHGLTGLSLQVEVGPCLRTGGAVRIVTPTPDSSASKVASQITWLADQLVCQTLGYRRPIILAIRGVDAVAANQALFTQFSLAASQVKSIGCSIALILDPGHCDHSKALQVTTEFRKRCDLVLGRS